MPSRARTAAPECADQALVEQADGFAVAVGTERVDAEVPVVGEGGEPAPVVGVGDEELDVGVVPGGGVEVVDRAPAQVEVLGEGGAAGRRGGRAGSSR